MKAMNSIQNNETDVFLIVVIIPVCTLNKRFAKSNINLFTDIKKHTIILTFKQKYMQFDLFQMSENILQVTVKEVGQKMCQCKWKDDIDYLIIYYDQPFQFTMYNSRCLCKYKKKMTGLNKTRRIIMYDAAKHEHFSN